MAELGVGFVGRRSEQTTLRAAATRAETGRAVAVFVDGPAGVGKSTLLRWFAGQLGERFMMVRLDADESSGDEPFGALRALLEVPPGFTPYAAGVALLRRLADLQAARPVALLVDDLHAFDSASRQALLVAVRRLEADRVLVVVASRPYKLGHDPAWERFRADADRCVELRLGAFSLDECEEVVRSIGLRLGDEVVARLHRRSEGHPLYFQALLRELSPAELQSPDVELRLPRSLTAAVLDRVTSLPSDAAALIEALSVLGQRPALASLGVVAGVDSPSAALEAGIRSGLVDWAPGEPTTPVYFTHALYRDAVYEGLSASRRRSLHAAAATVTDHHDALAHRVAAATGPDAGLVEQLDAAAREAAAAMNPRRAATCLEWSADLSVSASDRATRVMRAAEILLDSGSVESAQRLLPAIEAAEPSARRSLVLGVYAAKAGTDREAAELFAAAAEPSGPTPVVAAALTRLSLLHVTHHRGDAAVAAADRVLGLASPQSSAAQTAALMRSIGMAQRRGTVLGIDELERAFSFDSAGPGSLDVTVVGTRGMLQFYVGRFTDAEVSLRLALDRARDGASLEVVARFQALLSQVMLARGRWNEATTNARTAVELSSAEGNLLVAAQAHAALAAVAAARGAWDDASGHAAAAAVAARQVQTPEAVM